MKRDAPVKNNSAKTIPIKGQSIDNVYNQLKSMMYNQELVPGQKLILQDIARRLKTSTTPILQALNRLENAKLVRYVPNKGFFVAEITENEARELYQAREALEIYLIPTLLENMTEENISAIRESFRDHQDSNSPDYRRLLMYKDASFHLTIAKASANQVIVDLLEMVMERIYLKYRSEYLGDERIQKVLKQHRGILDALRHRDEEKAIQRTKEHIQTGLEHMISSLNNTRLSIL